MKKAILEIPNTILHTAYKSILIIEKIIKSSAIGFASVVEIETMGIQKPLILQ